MTHELRRVSTPILDIAYEAAGDGATAAVLVHGWPDDPRAWDGVTSRLHRAGVRIVAPYLRGFGPTRFRDAGTLRSGQISALVQDLLDLLDALGTERVLLVGHDWGARAAYGVAALAPERLLGLVACSVGYGTNSPAQQLPFDQARAYWYHWYFALERGREALARDRRDFVQRIWRLWAPSWRFDDAELDATAPSFDNPDWVDVTIHSYRHRWGEAAGDLRYDELEQRLAASAPVAVPTVMLHGAEDGATLPEASAGKERFFTAGYRREVLPGIGHFVPREAPEAVAQAALSLLATARCEPDNHVAAAGALAGLERADRVGAGLPAGPPCPASCGRRPRWHRSGCRPHSAPCAERRRPMQAQPAASSTAAPGAFFFTDSTPFSIAAADEYISLLPTCWPLPASSTKNGSPFDEVLRSKRASSAALVCTDLMPASASSLRS